MQDNRQPRAKAMQNRCNSGKEERQRNAPRRKARPPKQDEAEEAKQEEHATAAGASAGGRTVGARARTSSGAS
eukprot:6689935-Lingulodinium_polyedra.AAC.1